LIPPWPRLRLGSAALMRSQPSIKSLLLPLVALVIVGIGGATLFGFKVFDFNPAQPSASSNATPMANTVAGSPEKFHYLATQSSNFCGLQQGTVMSYSDSTRIQGACCNPLDMSTYNSQVTGLQAFSDVPVIPPDPYDVSAALAKQLLGYDRSIKLTADEKTVFDQAMALTPDKAPCCCKCWRWYAHEGLARYLIHTRHWDAQKVGKVVTLVNGCGGQRDTASRGSPSVG
jgi:hypothetical protein